MLFCDNKDLLTGFPGLSTPVRGKPVIKRVIIRADDSGRTGECFMERSRLFLIVGVLIIVIVAIAVLLTGSGSTVINTHSGYGTGQQAGQGQGYGTGPGSVAPALLPQTDTSSLSDTERADILFMREEEQMAYDLYTRWAGMYTVPIFSNIAQSETQHITEVQMIMGRYGLPTGQVGNASAGYRNATIRSLYESLVKKGDASMTGAFEAGLAVEERDIADLDHALAGTTRADILQVYASLRQGSENHRSAFLRQLGR